MLNAQQFVERRRQRKLMKAKRLASAAPHLTDGTIPGTISRMAFGVQLPQELKCYDTLVGDNVNYSGRWHLVSRRPCLVPQGTGFDQRVGRSIRVLGIVFRGACYLRHGPPNTTAPAPYALDFVWDNRNAGNPLPLGSYVYSSGVGVGDQPYALPSMINTPRFTWIKRVERDACRHANTTIDVSISCNRVITYLDNGDPTTDLLMYFSESINLDDFYVADFIQGKVRILYVDA